MACRKLDITDYFRLIPSSGNPDTSIYTSPATSPKSPRGFKPVVSVSISNYRYYSPELGRWLSRDPVEELSFYQNYIKTIEADEQKKELYQQSLMPVYLFVNNNSIENSDHLGLTSTWVTISGGIGGSVTAILGVRVEAGVAVAVNKCGGCFGLYFEVAGSVGAGVVGGPGISGDISTGPCCPMDREGTWSHYAVLGLAASELGGGEIQVMVDFEFEGGTWKINELTGGGLGGGPAGGMAIVLSIGKGSIYWVDCWHWPWATHNSSN